MPVTKTTKIKEKVAVKKTKATVLKAIKKTKVATPKIIVKKTSAVKKAEEEVPVKLRIRVKAYENKILDASVKQIMDTAFRHDAKVVGPVPLPIEIKKYTVNRSPFIYKNSREQFEIRVHKRMMDILNPSAKTIEALTNLNLPSGVDIEVTMG